MSHPTTKGYFSGAASSSPPQLSSSTAVYVPDSLLPPLQGAAPRPTVVVPANLLNSPLVRPNPSSPLHNNPSGPTLQPNFLPPPRIPSATGRGSGEHSSWFSAAASHVPPLTIPRGVSHIHDEQPTQIVRKLSTAGTAAPTAAHDASFSHNSSFAEHSSAPTIQTTHLTTTAKQSPPPSPSPPTLTGGGLGSTSLAASLREPTTPVGSRSPVSPRCGDFTIMRRQVLGSGAFGTVYKALDNVHGRQAAVKECLFKSQSKRRGHLDDEFSMLKKLHHPNIVEVYDFRIIDCASQIFMEWVAGGSVRDTMKQTGFRLHENVIRRFMFDTLQGLVYLHSMGVVHCDLKNQNFLLSNDGTVKITDFGASRVVRHDEAQASSGGIYGTVAFMSPEVVATGVHSFKSDIWAWASCVIELATNATPWADVVSRDVLNNPVSLMFHIGNAKPPNHHPPIPGHLSHDLQRILVACFQFNPDDRPSAAALLADRYWADMSVVWPDAEPLAVFQALLIEATNRRRSSLSSEESSAAVLSADATASTTGTAS